MVLVLQLSVMDKKLDQLSHVLNAVAQKQQIPLYKSSGAAAHGPEEHV